MLISKRVFGWLICLSALFLINTSELSAQTASTTDQTQEKDNQFAEKFWDYLLSNNYKHWSPAPGKSANLFTSRKLSATNLPNPHGTQSKLYINRTAASNPNALPPGSVLILENYRQDKSLNTISVMYKSSGFNPTGNDWFWVNYNADGTVTKEQTGSNALGSTQQTLVSARKSNRLAGRTTSCIQCHQSGGSDLVFFNSQSQKNRTAVGNQIVPLTNSQPSQALGLNR